MTDKEERIIEMLAFGTDEEIDKRKAEGEPISIDEDLFKVKNKEKSIPVDDDDYDYREDYASEDDIARENGFYVDEDGHWRELPDDYDLW